MLKQAPFRVLPVVLHKVGGHVQTRNYMSIMSVRPMNVRPKTIFELQFLRRTQHDSLQIRAVIECLITQVCKRARQINVFQICIFQETLSLMFGFYAKDL